MIVPATITKRNGNKFLECNEVGLKEVGGVICHSIIATYGCTPFGKDNSTIVIEWNENGNREVNAEVKPKERSVLDQR